MAEEKKVTNAAPAKAAVAVKKDDTKPGFFARVGKWFREMKSELKKVIWPTPEGHLAHPRRSGEEHRDFRGRDGRVRDRSLGLR